ncbi:pheromone-regulated protein prm10 [Stygiomarasmius scandens]
MFAISLSMRNQAPVFRKETVLLVGIACIGWVVNHFTAMKFNSQSDISAAFGAFAVGIVANLYARFLRGNAFVIMITGILFQVPSGLGQNGLLAFVSQQSTGSTQSYISGFQTALQLVSVAIGLTVGLGIALFLAHPIPSRRRAAGVFSM